MLKTECTRNCWLAAAVAGLLVWRTKIHLLWLLSIGAALGALGVI